MSESPEPANRIDGMVVGDVVQAGEIHGGVHFHQPGGRPKLDLPARWGAIPPRAAAFQTRATALTRTTVVSGLGGVGKTQLAVDHAERAWAAGELDLLVWVTATSRDAIVSSYADLAAELTGIVDPEPERGARRLLSLLATRPRWLVILDDLQNPADLSELWPPATGRTVVTTRRHDAALRGHDRTLIEADVFTPTEADAYLSAALAGQPSLQDGSAQLATALGWLPLALAQACAYLLDRDLSCADYLRRWTDRRQALARLLPEPDELPDEHRATVAVTWSLSVDQANRLEPAGLAQPLLEVAGYLSANGIPEDVFTTRAVAGVLGREVDADQIRDGLRCLRRLSLISLSAGTVRVHALVQRATRENLPTARRAGVAWTAADALDEIWPEIERDPSLGEVLRANTAALTDTGGEHLLRPDCHVVLFRAGHSLGRAGQVVAARDYFDRLRAAVTVALGADHHRTLLAHGHFARWLGESGDPVGAVAVLETLLADRLRVLGPAHRDTLTTRNALAYWQSTTGDAVGAVRALEALLADRLRLFGPDDPETLTTRHSLAGCRGQAGDAAGAVTAYEEVLADRLRVLSPDHPNTMETRSNLANWRGEAGDAATAAAAFRELLADRVRVLGPDHPDTLTTRGNLARWQGQCGDVTGAVAAYQELLADQLRLLGPDHPYTLTTRNNLAHGLGLSGDAAGAAVAFRELLTDRLRVLGAEHPHTVVTRDNLDYWSRLVRSDDPPHNPFD